MDCTLPSTSTWVLGLALAIGTFFSYTPQQIKIAYKRSSAGISMFYLFLALIFNFGQFTTTILSNWGEFLCCQDLTFSQCNELIMNVYQVAVMPVGTTIFVGLAMLFFDRFPQPGMDKDSHEFYDYLRKARRNAWLLMLSFCVILLVDFVICVTLLVVCGYDSNQVQVYADLITGIVICSTMVQFWPQIYRTFRNKKSGSISSTTLWIQCPGNFIVAAFQIASGSGWVVWIPFLNVGVNQLVLLGFVMYYDCAPSYRRKRKLEALEQTKLIQEDSDDSP
mmetsp:Transcript_15874/g.62022  ORF Transcript_15874/g.62022 Transcript_15874/m.62022 type:complete len:279 (-) Transcript_15874:40-876(-)